MELEPLYQLTLKEQQDVQRALNALVKQVEKNVAKEAAAAARGAVAAERAAARAAKVQEKAREKEAAAREKAAGAAGGRRAAPRGRKPTARPPRELQTNQGAGSVEEVCTATRSPCHQP